MKDAPLFSMIDTSNTAVTKTDPRPFLFALAVAALAITAWFVFGFFGEQRYHNTAMWQWLRPVVLVSPPQTARSVEVRDQRRNASTLVLTEKGLFFLGGTGGAPGVGEQVIVQANDHWELYLCDAVGKRCSTIHSFCAGAVSTEIRRDGQGRAEGCFAPHTGESAGSAREPPAEPTRGPGKRAKRMPPPVGMSHPREWAALMGLPVAGPNKGDSGS